MRSGYGEVLWWWDQPRVWGNQLKTTNLLGCCLWCFPRSLLMPAPSWLRMLAPDGLVPFPLPWVEDALAGREVGPLQTPGVPFQ